MNIFRLALIIAALGVAAILASNCSAQKPATTVEDRAQTPKQITTFKSMVIVRLHRPEDGSFFCSGTIISAKYVLTAGHCVGPMLGERVIVKDANGRVIDANAKSYSAEQRSDQGMVLGNFSKYTKTAVVVDPVANIDIWNTSSNLISCGYPYAGKLLCVQIKFIGPRNFLMAARGYLYPGMSGGPVYDMNSGKIIGVNTAVEDDHLILSPTIEEYSNLRIPAIDTQRE